MSDRHRKGKYDFLKLPDNTHLILVIHGTFAQDAQWWQPQSRFCKRLESKLRKKGIRAHCWLPPENLRKIPEDFSPKVPFRWSGANTETARERAALDLQILLGILFQNSNAENIHILAHSHGGNILDKAVKGFCAFGPDNARWDSCRGKFITLGTPFLHYKNKAALPFHLFWDYPRAGLIFVLGLTLASYIAFKDATISLVFAFTLIPSLLLLDFAIALYSSSWKGIFLASSSQDQEIRNERIFTICSDHDEALLALKGGCSLRENAGTIANRMSPNNLEPWLTSRLTEFRDGKWIPKDFCPAYYSQNRFGWCLEYISNILNLVLVRVPLLLFDNSAGRLISLLRSCGTRIAIRSGLRAIADRILGMNLIGLQLTGIKSYPQGIDSQKVVLEESIEEYLLEKATSSAASVTRRGYHEVQRIQDFYDIEKRTAELFSDLSLIHNLYYVNDAIVDKVAEVIAGSPDADGGR